MDKLRMKGFDAVGSNVAKIAALWPHCVTERLGKDGKPELAIDPDKLLEELGAGALEEGEERYQFTWPDKRKTSRLANTPADKALRPCIAESIGRDGTPGVFDSENLYIEGDNLDVLKLLRENYLGAVKMIYIDPPYNTGKDFVYHDNFTQTTADFEATSGARDEEGNLVIDPMQRNTESNGRFHTDWLNMIYPRLKVARDLLSDDGVICISIDDNEVENLRKICDEIWGASNFIAQIIIDGTPKNDPYVVSTAHEYCLVFCKNKEIIKEAEYGICNPLFGQIQNIFDEFSPNYDIIREKLRCFYQENDLIGDNIANYRFADERGVYRIGPIDDPQNSGAKDERINPRTGRNCATPARGWSCTIATWNEWIRDGLIEFPDSDDVLPAKKTYISKDRLDVMRAYFKMQTRRDTDALKRLFGTPITPFSNPKPVQLIQSFIENCNDKEMIILDFFSGSGTSMCATQLLNAKDGGQRKCILVQIPELIAQTTYQSNKEKKISSAAISFLQGLGKQPYVTEIAKERIRRAGRKIKEEAGLIAADLDFGFRVLKLDSSNMEDVFFSPEDTTEANLFTLVDNVKADRTPMDLLFQVMPELNIKLSAKVEEKELNGKKVFLVNDNYMVATFDKDVDEATIKAVAELRPTYFVMRDASAATDTVLDNFEQIFRHYSPDTIRRIL